MKKIISLFSAALVLVLATNSAIARPIEGRIDFVNGAVNVTGTGNIITSLAFVGTPTVDNYPGIITSDFASLVNAPAPFYDFNVTDVNPLLWTAGSFSFNITSITTNVLFPGIVAAGVLRGTGIISSTNPMFDDTAATWGLTAQGAIPTLSFSSTAIPAPAGAVLLGLCLVGFGFARRNKKS